MAQSDVTTVLGGLERHVLSLASQLARTGHHVAVVVPGKRSGHSVLPDGVELVHCRAAFTFGRFFYRTIPIHPQAPDPAFVPAVRGFVKAWQPDIVHSHGLAAFTVGLALHGLEIPWVHTLHEYGLLCPKESLWKLPEELTCQRPMTLSCIRCHNLEEPRSLVSPVRSVASLAGLTLSRKVLPTADAYIANSQYVADVHRRFFPKIGAEITVIPMFLDSSDDEEEPSIDFSGEFFLYAGSALPHKGLQLLLEAFQGMHTAVRLAVMAFGPPKMLDDLERKADQRTVFYRNAPHALVMAAWKRALFGVVPSVWAEPFGIVAIEAMSLGKPVIASAAGGLSDIVVDGETGILVPPGDVSALRLALERLMHDERLRHEMGLAGKRRFLTNFSKEVVMPKIEAVYSGLLVDKVWAS